jgi:adenine-specific DNA-methyltransferase
MAIINTDKYENYTREELLSELKKHVQRKKYGIVWEEERTKERFEEESQNKIPILVEDKSKEIKTDPSKPTNILIEGDNFHSLSVLNYTHSKSIDLIYIDPPYNTGSDGFRYNDRFISKEDEYRHSSWLSFMNKRLRLAKNLLKDSGVILISINEEEFSQLKLLCDDIFLPENYLANFTIKVRHEDRILKGDKDFHEVVEYLLFYRKSASHRTTKRERDNTSVSEYVFEIKELIKKPKLISLGNKTVQVFGPGEFEITKSEAAKTKLKKINIRGSLKEGNSSGRFFMKHLNNNGKFGYLYKVADMGSDDLGYRYFLTQKNKTKSNGDYFQGVPTERKDIKEIPYPNFFDFEEAFNGVGYEGGVEFRNGKKPIEFLLKVLEISGCYKNRNSIVLDFFAGSGSMGHAVLELNKEDKGNRKFILCTNNENNICTEITFPRIKNAIKGYKTSKGKKIAGLGGNLKYYRTAFVGSEPSHRNKIILTEKSKDMLCVKENTFEEVASKGDYFLFKNNDRYTGILLNVQQIEKFKKELLKLKKPIRLYIFSLEGDDHHEEFDDLKKHITLCPVPEAILKVYQRIYGKVN